MVRYVQDFTSSNWVERFLSQLEETNRNREERLEERLELQASLLLDAYQRCRYRVVIFNLEGVLTRYTALPELLDVSEPIQRCLFELGSHPDVLVVVKSPRSPETLLRLLGHLPITLAAEHGMFMRWYFPPEETNTAGSGTGSGSSSGSNSTTNVASAAASSPPAAAATAVVVVVVVGLVGLVGLAAAAAAAVQWTRRSVRRSRPRPRRRRRRARVPRQRRWWIHPTRRRGAAPAAPRPWPCIGAA